MNVLVYLVPMALLLGLTGLVGFLWSLSHGQYDDVEGAALRVLDDSDIAPPEERSEEAPK
jgi:cbb3-type cytochrome oxidase maturation protein